jgi:hypothetical protein
VNAIDLDKGENGQIVYQIDRQRNGNADWKNFNLDSKTGVLTLTSKLDISKQSTYIVISFNLTWSLILTK